MDLQTPSVLAQLPRPLHASTGKTHIGEVSSLVESKKRKRYEVVVAVDGEAVNIYNIQTPKLVTSYAVPPQSTFSCRPCSVRRKVPSKSSVKRQTFGAVSRPEHQIKSFVEETGGNGSSAPVISSSSFTVTDSKSPTVFVGVVPNSSKESDENDPFDILSVHKDGRIRRLSSDLKTQRWNIQHSETAKTASTHEVNTCFLVEFEDAKKALFKKRQDLAALALGDLTNSGVDEPLVLLVVSHPVGADKIQLKDVKVQMFSVPAVPSEGRSLDQSQRLRHLATMNFPGVDGQKTFNNDKLQWNFHSGSAGLNLSFERGFVNFDLSQYTPTVTSQFILDTETFSSVMRISPQSVIGAGQSIVALYDTQYQSVQRSIAVDDVPSSGAAPTLFLGYFAKLGLAVATKGNTLLAFDLSTSQPPSGPTLKRPRDGLLIEAIGRGIGSSTAHWDAGSKKHRTESMAALGLTSPAQVEKWKAFTVELDKCTQAKDAEGFDRAVLNYFGTEDSKSNKTLPALGQAAHPEATLFLLYKIFSVKEDRERNDKISASSSLQLSIVLWPQQTCNWLIRLGQLSPDNVEIALRRSFKPRILPSLPTGSFVQALMDTDPTLGHLISVIQGPVHMHADELSYALKILLDMVRTHSAALITNNTTSRTDDDPTPQSIFQALNTTLRLLHAQPPATRTQSLRAALPRQDLTALIHHLRISLATAGYTSRYPETPPTPISPDQTSTALSLETITDMITAAVDAVGPSGWISTAMPDSDQTKESGLISDLKAEITAALAGVQEASYLKGILREYLRFSRSVIDAPLSSVKGQQQQQQQQRADSEDQQLPSQQFRVEKLNGADLLVFNSAADGEEDGVDAGTANRMLPLSLQAASASTDVAKTKVKKSTGEVQHRSTREIGYLRRKAVGKYSFERLVV